MYITIFFIASLGELYFFLLQRSALEISRKFNVDPVVGRSMLPSWYLFHFVAQGAKYWALYIVYREQGFLTALFFFVVGVILLSIVPVPHTHYVRIFEKEVYKLSKTDPMLAARLTVMLLAQK